MFYNDRIIFSKRHLGFSLIEMLIVITIISILAALSYVTFFDTNRTQALEKDRDLVIATLEQARSLTLASSGARQFGVHIQSDRIVLFPGSSYVSGNSENKTEFLNPLVTIASSSIAGGGTDITFERLTGKTSKTGTIGISLQSDPQKSYVITVSGTGVIESN